MRYPLAKQAVFWTLQGEGALMGTPMAFVRLAGCSVGCAQCDTDYGVARRATAEDIVEEVQRVVPADFPVPWVWLTGGEPTDHDLGPLSKALHAAGYGVALATAGVRNVPVTEWGINWLSISPHSAAFPQRFAHELKVVPLLNGLSWADVETIDRDRHSYPWRFIQPIEFRTPCGPEQDSAANRESLRQCIAFVSSHPGWRLTMQAHKHWDLP